MLFGGVRGWRGELPSKGNPEGAEPGGGGHRARFRERTGKRLAYSQLLDLRSHTCCKLGGEECGHRDHELVAYHIPGWRVQSERQAAGCRREGAEPRWQETPGAGGGTRRAWGKDLLVPLLHSQLLKPLPQGLASPFSASSGPPAPGPPKSRGPLLLLVSASRHPSCCWRPVLT